ncbi:N-acetylgalactosamine kinase isoform X2 [Oratosquilla oratoria]
MADPKELMDAFKCAFGHPPQFIARAPGRVNLIGEHIDYCGYAVLPMAIELDIVIAVSLNEQEVLHITNIDDTYLPYSCDINNFEISGNKPSWYKYVLCGIRGILDEGGLEGKFHGLNMVVKGTIPPSSGLSSSSALVCASALAVAHAHNLNLSKEKLAEICARSERHIGTQGGGMDQAISFLATKGTARLIEFNPLKTMPVSLPEGANFVVANCLAPVNKAATSHYNCRVMECRLACQVLAKLASIKWQGLRKLLDLQKALGKSLPEMIEMVKKNIHKEPYTKTEICEILEVTEAHLNEITLSENTRHIQEFNLHDRALHVFTEAHRVWEFKQICESDNKDVESVLNQLGKVMFESHESTQYYYECSHPKLDKLVELSKSIAYGARLTGAGWGGCMIALVPTHALEEYQEKLLQEFYAGEESFKVKNMSSVLFTSKPGAGACVIDI